ncbi:MAG: hypothetical protein AAF485_25700, partial [Chloroflexota bacterium]
PIGLIPLVWLGLTVPWFGPVSVALLFNAIVTALTAVFLLAYLKHLGFKTNTGLIVALGFGLTTLAWPYAKSLFSDPLAGLLLLAAAYWLKKGQTHLINKPHSQTQVYLYTSLAGLLLGWNVATRYAEAIFLPIYGVVLLAYLDLLQRAWLKRLGEVWPILVAFGLPVLLIGLSLLGFNLSRYGDPFNTGYLPNETFSGIWWRGIVGQLISPGRGLLLYCPLFILSFVGLWNFFYRFRIEALLALAVIIIHLLLYGKWFMWHGGYAWGPRFMIPTLPFWAIFLAPVVHQAFRKNGNSVLRLIFLGLAIIGLIPQLLSNLIDFSPFQDSLLDTGLPLFAQETFFQLRFSPFVSAWQFIQPDTLDLAWAWQGIVEWRLISILIISIIVNVYYLEKVFWLDSNLTTRKTYYLPSTTLLVPTGVTLFTLIILMLHAHTLPEDTLKQAITEINKNSSPTELVITNTPELTTDFAELYKGKGVVLGLNSGGSPLPQDITQRLDDLTKNHEKVWWLPNWLPPHESGVEQTLLANGYRAYDNDFSGQRLALFGFPAHLGSQVSENQLFDEKISLQEAVLPQKTSPKTILPLRLSWQAKKPINENYHIFIHLVDREGQALAQTDGQPVYWVRPTSTWEVDETIVDRHALWIPESINPGQYQIFVGLYQPETGQRLQTDTGEDTITLMVDIEAAQ